MSFATQGARAPVLSGVEEAVCAVLGIANLKHRSALNELSLRDSIPDGSLVAAFNQIDGNWTSAKREELGSSSQANWRWCEPQLKISKHNASPEVVLERAIAQAFDNQGAGRWANQVPVVSGVAGPYAERRRAIDLVERVDEGAFRLIELKVASDTPLYAAYEILFYLLIWLVARTKAEVRTALLDAQRMEALVLAPASYYQGLRLGPLEALLANEIAALGGRHGVSLHFAFERLPADFAIEPPYEDKALINAMNRCERL